MSHESVKRKRNSGSANKRWNEALEISILNYLLDLAPKNKEFEKPNKREFYKKMSEELKLTVTDSSQTMNKVKNMRKSYVNAVDWKSNTGQGVESGTVDDHVKRMCPYFDTMEEIFGHKTNVVPPFIYESRLDNDQEIESHQLGIDEPNQSDDYSNGRSLYEDNENVDTSIYGNDDQGNGLVADDYTCEEYLDEFSEVERGAFMVDQASGSIVLENEVIDLRQEFTNLAEVIVSPSNVSEVSRFKKLLVTAPPISTAKSKPSQKSDKDNISRFKKRLMISPVAETDKTIPEIHRQFLLTLKTRKLRPF